MRLMGRKTNSQPEESKGSPSCGPLLFLVAYAIRARAHAGMNLINVWEQWEQGR